jgi:hypothetical protein
VVAALAAIHGDRPAHQIGRQFRQPLILSGRPAEFDGNVLPLDEALLRQAFGREALVGLGSTLT